MHPGALHVRRGNNRFVAVCVRFSIFVPAVQLGPGFACRCIPRVELRRRAEEGVRRDFSILPCDGDAAMDNQTNRLLAEIRDEIREAATARHRDMERFLDQLTKFREALVGRIDHPKRRPKALANGDPVTRRKRRVSK
jgi:hypothetical protein